MKMLFSVIIVIEFYYFHSYSLSSYFMTNYIMKKILALDFG